MKTAGKGMVFVRLIILAGIISVCFTGQALSGIVRDIPAELNEQESHGLKITLSLVDAKKRNIIRPGKPVSLQATFLNTGTGYIQVLYSRVYRAGNLVIMDGKGQRVAPQMNTLIKYNLLGDDWHLFGPGQGMQIPLEGSLTRDKKKSPDERTLVFDEIDYTFPNPGEYTVYFVLRQEEPSRSGYVIQYEWTGCAISNAVNITVR